MTKVKNPQRAMRPYTTRSTDPVAIRATQTRRRSRGILLALDIQLPNTRGMQSRISTSCLTSGQSLPADTDPQALTLHHAWEAYLDQSQDTDPTRTNAERSPSDLGNKKRALRDLALGHGGQDDLSGTPLSLLTSDWEELHGLVTKGLEQRLGNLPNAKKASNIRSDLKKIRGALHELLQLPALTRINPATRRAPRKGHWKKGFRKADWPEGLGQEIAQMRAAFTDRNYSGPSYPYFNKHVMREVTFQSIETRFNRLIDFAVNSEGLTDPRLMDLMDVARVARFRDWHFHERTGGYPAFVQICGALAKTAIYLEATGQLESGHDLESKHHTAPWRVFVGMGVIKLKQGVEEGKTAGLEELPLISPQDIKALALRCQKQLPRTADGRAPSTRQIFHRRFAAVFFGLGIYMPLRGKNWRNMQWGTNLKREGDSWRVHFSGLELKNGVQKTKLRTYSLLLPPNAAEWIEWWREQLRVFVGEDFETITPFVFPIQSTLKDLDGQFHWVSMSHKYLLAAVDEAARDNLGQGFRPHMIRHCVATHVISSGKMADVQQAATLLGDSIKTVIDKYFKPDEQKLLNVGYYTTLEQGSGDSTDDD